METFDGLEVVHLTDKGFAHFWFRIRNGTMYRIHYANGKRDPLATNSMKIIEEELGGIEQKGQLTIKFKP